MVFLNVADRRASAFVLFETTWITLLTIRHYQYFTCSCFSALDDHLGMSSLTLYIFQYVVCLDIGGASLRLPRFSRSVCPYSSW